MASARASQSAHLLIRSRFAWASATAKSHVLSLNRTSLLTIWSAGPSSNLPPTARHPLPQRADAMASRQLALNFQRSLRSRAAINSVKSAKASPLTRGLATPVSYGSKTESTTLSNGFTVWAALSEIAGLQLTLPRRSLPSTPHGPRRRPSVCGSMPVPALRRTRRTEPRTSSSTLPSR